MLEEYKRHKTLAGKGSVRRRKINHTAKMGAKHDMLSRA